MPTTPTYQISIESHRRAARQWRTYLLCFTVMFGGFAAKLFEHGEKVEAGFATLMALLSVWTAFNMGNKRRIEKAIRKSFEMSARTGVFDAMQELCAYEVSESGIRIVTSDYSAEYSWRFVERIEETSTFIGLALRNSGAFVFPRIEVIKTMPVEEFISQMNVWHATSGRSSAESVGAYVAHRDVRCPSCGYNLRGVLGSVCPECGKAIDVESLRASVLRESIKEKA